LPCGNCLLPRLGTRMKRISWFCDCGDDNEEVVVFVNDGPWRNIQGRIGPFACMHWFCGLRIAGMYLLNLTFALASVRKWTWVRARFALNRRMFGVLGSLARHKRYNGCQLSEEGAQYLRLLQQHKDAIPSGWKTGIVTLSGVYSSN